MVMEFIEPCFGLGGLLFSGCKQVDLKEKEKDVSPRPTCCHFSARNMDLATQVNIR